jgi:hypothetical protein
MNNAVIVLPRVLLPDCFKIPEYDLRCLRPIREAVPHKKRDAEIAELQAKRNKEIAKALEGTTAARMYLATAFRSVLPPIIQARKLQEMIKRWKTQCAAEYAAQQRLVLMKIGCSIVIKTIYPDTLISLVQNWKDAIHDEAVREFDEWWSEM